MRIALIGYGKMNRAIAAIAAARGHEIGPCITSTQTLLAADLGGIDLVMEFSTPKSAVANLTILAERAIPTIAGTTGFSPETLGPVREIVARKNGAMLWSPNFSIGMNLFLQLTEQLSRLINARTEYDIFVRETHHRLKADAPSGTGWRIAETIVAAGDRKRAIVTGCPNRALEPSELHISSARGGSSPGCHCVTVDGPDDTIELTHTARSRDVFASGAVRAAEWLAGKSGWFDMEDFLSSLRS
jgi:4-hydroxy-tetrahydrodipicolinate reductase